MTSPTPCIPIPNAGLLPFPPSGFLSEMSTNVGKTEINKRWYSWLEGISSLLVNKIPSSHLLCICGDPKCIYSKCFMAVVCAVRRGKQTRNGRTVLPKQQQVWANTVPIGKISRAPVARGHSTSHLFTLSA